MQVEQAEAEIEALQGTGKKRNKAGSSTAGRTEELEQLNERRKWHISRLEIVLRLLNNGSMPTDKVLGLKDDVQYFVESNTVRCITLPFQGPGPFKAFCECRKKISTKTKAYTMTSTLMRRKRNSALPQATTIAMNRTWAVKVRIIRSTYFIPDNGS